MIGRFNSDGSTDVSFRQDGFTITTIGYGAIGNDVKLQADGKIVEAASASNGMNDDLMVARYLTEFPLEVPDVKAEDLHNFIFPNPVTGYSFTFQYEIKNQKHPSVYLLNASGELMQFLINNQARVAEMHRELLHLPKRPPERVYYIVLKAGSSISMMKLVKQ